MPFEKGNRANPGGRPKTKPWSDALRIAANCEDDNDKDKTKLRRIAEKTVEMAMGGDIAAIKEIGDRLEGKPAQTIAGDEDNPLNLVHTIERVIIGQESKN